MRILNKELFYDPIANFPTVLVVVFIVWALFWKGLSMWKAARNNQSWWYVALLILSTGGILEIVYLAFFQKKRK
ncbi:MAG: hypothetical protein UX25_C0040G0006 [Candidatus Woesebacteria bacterium GW2011_GWC2_45_9]|uniref:DUF5652 domain-containing protein n=1 Tax=Candidatus Woesebacteria bacterium GW2011_GWC2_45_9 TaxID=1618589 RepID=A0A0G1N6P9_9BACT|nr:MAG: hypothetical protein UX25_C0040G0006 [Candidatus Woesebacteria bacterium GW2011_GWC2_45_9]